MLSMRARHSAAFALISLTALAFFSSFVRIA